MLSMFRQAGARRDVGRELIVVAATVMPSTCRHDRFRL